MTFTAAPVRTSDFLKWEVDPDFTRKSVTIGAGLDLDAGAVLGVVTATGKYVLIDPEALTGESTAKAILLTPAAAASADVTEVAVLVRGPAIVDSTDLNYSDADAGEIATINAALEALGIKVVAGVGYQPFAI